MKLSADDYEQATIRNLGLISEAEQALLRRSTVAIAGMGAVGGHYLIALTRLGVGRFIIADPDIFEAVNLHRQAGAFKDTLGKGKTETMARMARDINPDLDLRLFPGAVTESNAAEFLQGADLVLDGIDFFQIDARRALHNAAREQGLYSITSGPIGYGASLQVFDPRGMTFDAYFGIRDGMTRAERLAAFATGLIPNLSKTQAMDAARVDFEREKGPALVSAIMLCTGIVVNEVMRILTRREAPLCVPHALFFDPYGRSFTRRRRPRNRWIGRLVQRLVFRRYPSLVRLHQAEKQAALGAV